MLNRILARYISLLISFISIGLLELQGALSKHSVALSVARLLRKRMVPDLNRTVGKIFFVLYFPLALCSLQLEQAHANEIKYDIHLASSLFR